MASFVQVPPGCFRTRPQLQGRFCAPQAHRTQVRRKVSACAAMPAPAPAPGPDEGSSPIAAADLKLLSYRISEMKDDFVADDRILASNWKRGRHRQSVVACVPGANFVRRIAADGNLLACGTADGTFCLFDTASGERAVRKHASTGQTTSVCVQGSYAASVGSADQCIAVWDVRALRTSRNWAEHLRPSLDADGPALPPPLLRLSGHENIVTALAIDARWRTLYSASVDGTIRAWCLESGVCRNVIRVGEPILTMRFTGRYLLAGTASGRVQAYNAVRGLHLLSMQAHESPCTAIFYHEDTNTLASGCAAGEIKLWDYNRGRLLGEPERHDNAVMALHVDDARVVSASRDGTIAVARTTDCKQLYSIPGYSVFITSLVVDKGNIIADGTNNLITARSFANV